MNFRRLASFVLLLCSCCLLAPVALSASQPARQELASGSALLVDLQSNQVLYASNPDVQLPIASLTKLMTAMVVLDASLPMDQQLQVIIRDVPEMHGVYSRVRIGSELSRRNLLQLTLMSSENRAAATLAHHYPGGVPAFVAAMNAKAQALGMQQSRFTEPTGLSAGNLSSARDLVRLIEAGERYPLIGQLSSIHEASMSFRKPVYSLGFRNTNRLVFKPDWSIQLSKTGFTNAAGRCLVMKTRIDGKPVAFVVLDAYGKYTHMADANRLKKWLETGKVTPVPPAALAYKKQKEAQRLSARN